MPVDVLLLNSGEWVLAEELPAEPWHVLIYRQRDERRNELHIWLPRDGVRGDREYAFKRYWVDGPIRWCIEVPRDPDRIRGALPAGARAFRMRFSAPGGIVLWADSSGARRLADLSDAELVDFRRMAAAGPYTRI